MKLNPLLVTLCYKSAGIAGNYVAQGLRNTLPPDPGPLGLVGAVEGAGLGGLLGAAPGLVYSAFDDETPKPQRRRKMIQRALMGAIPGALAGGIGLGAYGQAAANQMNAARKPLLDTINKLEHPPSGLFNL